MKDKANNIKFFLKKKLGKCYNSTYLLIEFPLISTAWSHENHKTFKNPSSKNSLSCIMFTISLKKKKKAFNQS